MKLVFDKERYIMTVSNSEPTDQEVQGRKAADPTVD